VAILSMMETSTSKSSESWRLSSVNRIWAAAAKNGGDGQDRQVHEGVEGGHLVDDGDIHIQVIKSWRLNSVIRIWAAAAKNDGEDRQQDRQVHEGVGRGHLVDDGDIHIKTSIDRVTLQCEQHLGCGCNDSSNYIESRTKPARRPARTIRSRPWPSWQTRRLHLYGDPDSCSVNRNQTAAVMTSDKVECLRAIPRLRAAAR
jgi:hypothetical protein